jgi:hypothetical protein
MKWPISLVMPVSHGLCDRALPVSSDEVAGTLSDLHSDQQAFGPGRVGMA